MLKTLLRSEQIQLEESTGAAYQALDTEISKKYTPKPKGEVRILLPKEYSAKAISGDSGIIDSVTRMFGVVDRLITPVRISEVFESFAKGKDGSGTGTFHSDWVSSHQGYFALYCVVLAVCAGADEYLYRKEQEKKDKEIQQNIYKLFEQDQALKKKEELISQEDEAIKKRIIWNNILFNLNNYLNDVYKSDKALQEKYDAISIEDRTTEKGEIVRELVFKQKSREVITKQQKRGVLGSIWAALGSIWEYGVKPFYRAGGFAGFAFWILWMGVAASTGIQLEGIFGMTPWVGLGIPAGFGLLQLGLYYRNAYKYGGFEKARQHAEAVADFDALLKALKQREHDREMESSIECNKRLDALLAESKLSFEEASKSRKNLGLNTSNGTGFINKLKDGFEHPLIKGTFTIVGGTAGTWGGANSYSWYIKVLVETAYASIVPAVLSAPLIGTVVGGVILGLAGLSGIYNGIKRYKEAKALKDAPLQAICDKYSLCILKDGVNLKELKLEEGKLYLHKQDGCVAYLIKKPDGTPHHVKINTLEAPKPFSPQNLLNLKKEIIGAAVRAGSIQVPTPMSLKKFEEHYNSRLAYLETLKLEMQDYKNRSPNSKYPVPIPESFNVSEKKSEKQSFLTRFRNHPAIDAFDMGLAGIFVGRVIFTTAAPFLLSLFLPVALMGPVGIAAILGVGIAFFGLKWYERCQIKKEQRIKQFPGKLEALEKNIEEAELVVNNIRKSELLIKRSCTTHEKQQEQSSPEKNVTQTYGKLFEHHYGERRVPIESLMPEINAPAVTGSVLQAAAS